MPKMLKKFEFAPKSTRAIYDWNQLLNGKPWQLTAGEDYECKNQTFLTLAKDQAARRGQEFNGQEVEEGKGVVIQAVGSIDEEKGTAYVERQKELAKQRKEKAKAKALSNGETEGESEEGSEETE